MQQATELSTAATNQHCGWHLYFYDIAHTHSPVIHMLSVFCRVFGSLRCCNKIYYRNASQLVSGLAIGRLDICLGQQKFTGRHVLKNLSWALGTVFLAFDEHFSLHKNNQNWCYQTRLLGPKYTKNASLAVFDLSGVQGFNPPLVEDDPLTGDCKVWSGGGRIRPPRKGQKSKFVVESL